MFQRPAHGPTCWQYFHEHTHERWILLLRAPRQGVPRRVPSLTTLVDSFAADMDGDKPIHRCLIAWGDYLCRQLCRQ